MREQDASRGVFEKEIKKSKEHYNQQHKTIFLTHSVG